MSDGLCFMCGVQNWRHNRPEGACVACNQARTIRRLRALADGYRNNWKLWKAMAKATNELLPIFMRRDQDTGATLERARIVAALRGFAAACVDRGDAKTGGEVYALSDAIERGEL